MVTAYSRDSDPLVGTTIADKYRVVSLIARGGMGRVYRGLQLALEREVALKVLDLGRLGESGSSEAVIDDFRRRFVLEAASAAKLTHPNTIVIHDYGVERDGLLYMVMELIEGQTLAERIEKDGALRPETVVRIMAQVCGSLAEAHGRGMVHRGSGRLRAGPASFSLAPEEEGRHPRSTPSPPCGRSAARPARPPQRAAAPRSSRAPSCP